MVTLFADMRLVRYAASTDLGLHRHDEPSFSLVVGGLYQEQIQDRSAELGPGSLVFVPAHELHSQRFGATGALKVVLRPTQAALERIGHWIALEDAPIVSGTPLAGIARRIAGELATGDEFSPEVLTGLSHELVGLLGRVSQAEPMAAPRLVRDVAGYLANDQEAAVSLQALAAQFDCDPVALQRAFQREHGMTIGQYQRHLRASRAANLLANSTMPIAEIAVACGYSDQAHLTRAIRKIYGTTPASLRRQR